MDNQKITAKQKKGIKLCETILNVKFEGKTRIDASKFLADNLPKVQGKDIREYKKPSDKMLSAIEFIENTVEGAVFKGKTMKEASEFIELHLDEARSLRKNESI